MTTSRSDAPPRERPAWAEPVADADRIVTCGGCGEAMPWRRFARGHLRKYGEGDGEGADR